MKILLLGAAAFAAITVASNPRAYAYVDTRDEVCRVADPTGTPLNVRTSPYGTIVATFKNGDPVTVLDTSRDRRGSWWVYVGTPELKPIGWVYRNFINCGPVAPSYYDDHS